MAFVSMIDQLPNDGVLVNIYVFYYPGILIEATYDSVNMVFITATSGLLIKAESVLEWEEII